MKNKGITLIGLVITIMVLLILAGVTIAALSGENGILMRATEAREKTNEENLTEEVQMAVMETFAEHNGNFNTETFKEKISLMLNNKFNIRELFISKY